MRETWYVLDDGTAADPSECAADDSGVLRHASGQAVAMRSADTPRSRSVDVEVERARAQAAPKTADMDAGNKNARPSTGKGYKTRDGKAG